MQSSGVTSSVKLSVLMLANFLSTRVNFVNLEHASGEDAKGLVSLVPSLLTCLLITTDETTTYEFCTLMWAFHLVYST